MITSNNHESVRLEREIIDSKLDLHKRQYASTLITFMSLITCVLCFIPIYAPYEGSIRAVDDYAYFTGFLHVPIYEQAGISVLLIAVLPGLDIFMDILPSSLFSSITWYDMKHLEKEGSGMTKLEHFLFIIGMIFASSSAWPSVTNSTNALNLYICFENCSTILTSCPLLSFVVRRSSTWSPIMCPLLSFLICCGPFVSSLALCFDPTSALVAQMNMSSSIIICISTGLYLINTLWTLYKSFQWEKVTLTPVLNISLHRNPTIIRLNSSTIILKFNCLKRYCIR